MLPSFCKAPMTHERQKSADNCADKELDYKICQFYDAY